MPKQQQQPTTHPPTQLETFIARNTHILMIGSIVILIMTIIVMGVYYYAQIKQIIKLQTTAIRQEIQLRRIQLAIQMQSISQVQIGMKNGSGKSIQTQERYFNSTINKLNQLKEQLAQIQAIKLKIQNQANHNQQFINKLKPIFDQIDQHQQIVQSLLSPPNCDQHQPTLSLFGNTLWLFMETQATYNSVNQLYLQNVKDRAKQAGFIVKIITFHNYYFFLTTRRMEILTDVLTTLQKRVGNDQHNSNLHLQFPNIAKTLIMTHVLEQHGGIAIADQLLLLQSLEWVNHIQTYSFVNRGTGKQPPQVIVFYNPQKSHGKSIKIQDSDGQQQLVYKITSLCSFFIAAIKNSQLIKDINNKMIELLTTTHPNINYSNTINAQKQTDLYEQIFQISSVIILEQKQKIIDSLPQLTDEPNHKYALDYYGLHAINCYYGPYKLQTYFAQTTLSNTFNSIAKITTKQLQTKIGKIRFIAYLPFASQLHKIITNQSISIIKSSFLQHHLILPQKYTTINVIDNYQEIISTFQASHPKWLSLPRKLWIFRSSHIKPQNKMVQYQCITLMRQYGQAAGFQINLIDQDNIQLYLSKTVKQQIDKAWFLKIYPYSDRLLQFMYTLAILNQHGGIYFNSNLVILQNLQWIINAADINRWDVFNRVGLLPHTLMFYDSKYAETYNFTIDSVWNTRINQDLEYDLNFIATEPELSMMEDWFQQLLTLLKMPISDIAQRMKSCQTVSTFEVQTKGDALASESLKCVLKRRRRVQKIANLNLQDYIWGLDGYVGPLKFGKNINLQNVNQHANSFLMNYSRLYTEQIIGKARFMIQLNQESQTEMGNIMKNINNKKYFNKQSIFRTYFLG